MEPSSSRAGVNDFKHPPGQSNDRHKVILRLYTDPNEKSHFTVLKLSDDRKFDFSRSLKILIHGLNSHHLAAFPQDMKDVYLASFHNVIIVDWAELAVQNLPSSFPAILQLRLHMVSLTVTEILQHLVTTSKLDVSKVHLLGQSIGCHVSAIIGKSFRARGMPFGRITAFDPLQHEAAAQLSDAIFEDNDANSIDVYHAKAYSQFRSVGHVDFFIREKFTRRDGSSGYEDACNIFLQTIAEEPGRNDVTYLVPSNLSGQKGPAGIEDEKQFDGPIVFGEHCTPGTKGQYGVEYDCKIRAVVGGFKQNSA